ncbi:MAG: hypothetical protein ABIR24_00670 [Verrucomicrobiota bacterium]
MFLSSAVMSCLFATLLLAGCLITNSGPAVSETVSVTEVTNYVFGNYADDFPSPPHADGNPKRAIIISWKNFPFKFVFSHEASYCPWFEFPSGAGHSFQFFEGNDGWGEIFNRFGRRETNSFVEILEHNHKRVHVRWTYFGVERETGVRAFRSVEDFWAFPNGHILRRQTFQTLMPGDHRGYAREPVEMIGLCPKGKLSFDVLQRNPADTNESHALAVFDAFSTNRYDVFWKHKTNTLWESTARRTGCEWKLLDDSRGVVLVTPMHEGAAFCVMGEAGGFGHEFTRLKEHTFKDTGGEGWISMCWDHWPIGWLDANSVNAESFKKYPNHFSPMGMDLFALRNEDTEKRVFYSLIGVCEENLEPLQRVARTWLESGKNNVTNLEQVARLPRTFR